MPENQALKPEHASEPGRRARRGHKTVMRFFPNQAADLEPVLALLARLDAEVRRALGFKGSWGTGH